MRSLAIVALLGTVSSLVLALPSRSVAGDNPATGWGTVKGRVVFAGATLPQAAPLDVNKDQAHCLQRGPILSEEWVINPTNKGVRWVFVWLAPEPGGSPLPVHPSLQQVKQPEVAIDQPCCKFEPHALALREGQVLVAKNTAPINHNVHWIGHPLKNPGGNVIVPAGGAHRIEGLKADRIPVQVKCDIHPWMKAHVFVFNHPYYAVTDADGNFEIKNAPAGTYRLASWHDTGYGPGEPSRRDGIKITVPANGTAEITVKLPVE